MGYTTDFTGEVTVEPPLNEHEISFLTAFNKTRRMARARGPLFVKGSDGEWGRGQGHDDDVLDFNEEPPDQPGLWCQWVPNDEGTTIKWDEGEKFYEADRWMAYIVYRLLAPSAKAYIAQHIGEDERLQHFTCDHSVNGTISAQGEDSDDRWDLVVKDNVVRVVSYEATPQGDGSIVEV